jgi:hypothetical protein
MPTDFHDIRIVHFRPVCFMDRVLESEAEKEMVNRESKVILEEDAFTKWMARHLVAMVGTYHTLDDKGKPRGDERIYCFPGFVIDVVGQWCWVTAAHNLIDVLGKYVANGWIRVNKYSFMDYFGPDAKVKRQTPFSYEQEMKVRIEDPKLGVDFGLIPLRDLFQKGFEANGVVPFQCKHWIGSDQQDYEVFAMLGCPTELVEPLSRTGEKVSQVGASISMTIVPIRRIEEIPDTLDAPSGNWFVGRVNPPFSIEGMSGSPIFGFRRNDQHQWEYRLVAIQSRWFKDHQIILATPISPVMSCFEETVWERIDAVLSEKETHAIPGVRTDQQEEPRANADDLGCPPN